MFWYGSLLLSLWCVIIAFHLGILFSAYDASSDRAARLLDMIKHRNKLQPRKKSLQVLQMPIALFSWGIISYIIGLAILVLRPLWTSGWVRESWVRQNSFSCQGLMLIGGIDCHRWVGVRDPECRGLYLDCVDDIRTSFTRSSSAKQHTVSMIVSII